MLPIDRPRGEGTSWKSEEYKYTKKSEYINPEAYKRLPEGMVPEVKDFGLMKTIDENGISRYWVGVGPRVMDIKYDVVGTEKNPIQIDPDRMHYGTKIDVILRDSCFNVYYMPAIVGDIKEHTLNKNYEKDGIIGNGIYQTGVTWVQGKDTDSETADGAVIEFIREPHEKDDLINTPEFDILGIIVYD